jgi:hypothetical protein
MRREWTQDVFAGKPAPVGARKSGPENFTGNDQRFALQVLDGFAHDNFGLTVGVHIGIIKKINALFVSGMNKVNGGLFVNLIAKSEPCPQ